MLNILLENTLSSLLGLFINAMGAMHSSVPKIQQKQVSIWVNFTKTHNAKYMYNIGVSNKYTILERHKSAAVAYVVLGMEQIDKKINALARMPKYSINCFVFLTRSRRRFFMVK
jgi:hypothetical protein